MLKWLRNSSPSSSIFSVKTIDNIENKYKYEKRQYVCFMQHKLKSTSRHAGRTVTVIVEESTSNMTMHIWKRTWPHRPARLSVSGTCICSCRWVNYLLLLAPRPSQRSVLCPSSEDPAPLHTTKPPLLAHHACHIFEKGLHYTNT